MRHWIKRTIIFVVATAAYIGLSILFGFDGVPFFLGAILVGFAASAISDAVR